jgi:plastocyanin
MALALLLGLLPPVDHPRPGSGIVVTMTGDDTFEPQVVTIYSGEDVEWRNAAPSVRTIIGDPLRASHRSDVEPPSPPEPFHSDPIEPGRSFQRRFTIAGAYRYVCFEREGKGMNGTVLVKGRP